MSDQEQPIDEQSESKALNVVRWLTEKAIVGIPPLTSAESLAQEYLIDKGYPDDSARIDSLINWETTKNFTSGFLTGLGGILTLPIAIPAAMGASWIVQARLAATIAKISGYDILCDRVQTFVIATLVGDALKDIVKNAGIQISRGLAQGLLKQIPGKVLIQINKQVGFRLLTKAGSTGAINLVKFIPFVGGAVGGTIDAYACRVVGRTAKDIFYQASGEKEDDVIVLTAEPGAKGQTINIDAKPSDGDAQAK